MPNSLLALHVQTPAPASCSGSPLFSTHLPTKGLSVPSSPVSWVLPGWRLPDPPVPVPELKPHSVSPVSLRPLGVHRAPLWLKGAAVCEHLLAQGSMGSWRRGLGHLPSLGSQDFLPLLSLVSPSLGPTGVS